MTDRIYRDVSEIRRANVAADHHFFDADAMAFFDSRIEDGGKVYGGRYFITSEQFHFRGEAFPRKYTIRRADADGTVHTVLGTWQEYASMIEARAAAEAIASHVTT